MNNPLAMLPPKARAVAYAVLGLAAIGIGAWQAADGDILVALSLGLGALGFGTALSNTPVRRGQHVA